MDSKERFSTRVQNYVKFRPDYPEQLLDAIFTDLELDPEAWVADIGSGTGKFTRLLLERGQTVYAVEPNAEMRQAAEESLAANPRFESVDGSAEQTTLPDQTVQAIVCAQSFHWFELNQAREEFRRILVPGGKVALIWNKRDVQRDSFAQAYESLLRKYAPEYEHVKHGRLGAAEFGDFFLGGTYTKKVFDYGQQLTFDELLGRALSSSYTPLEGSEDYDSFVNDLRALHTANEHNGYIDFYYKSELYYGAV